MKTPKLHKFDDALSDILLEQSADASETLNDVKNALDKISDNANALALADDAKLRRTTKEVKTANRELKTAMFKISDSLDVFGDGPDGIPSLLQEKVKLSKHEADEVCEMIKQYTDEVPIFHEFLKNRKDKISSIVNGVVLNKKIEWREFDTCVPESIRRDLYAYKPKRNANVGDGEVLLSILFGANSTKQGDVMFTIDGGATTEEKKVEVKADSARPVGQTASSEGERGVLALQKLLTENNPDAVAEIMAIKPHDCNFTTVTAAGRGFDIDNTANGLIHLLANISEPNIATARELLKLSFMHIFTNKSVFLDSLEKFDFTQALIENDNYRGDDSILKMANKILFATKQVEVNGKKQVHKVYRLVKGMLGKRRSAEVSMEDIEKLKALSSDKAALKASLEAFYNREKDAFDIDYYGLGEQFVPGFNDATVNATAAAIKNILKSLSMAKSSPFMFEPDLFTHRYTNFTIYYYSLIDGFDYFCLVNKSGFLIFDPGSSEDTYNAIFGKANPVNVKFSVSFDAYKRDVVPQLSLR